MVSDDCRNFSALIRNHVRKVQEMVSDMSMLEGMGILGAISKHIEIVLIDRVDMDIVISILEFTST